jgi:hypothetical protein
VELVRLGKLRWRIEQDYRETSKKIPTPGRIDPSPRQMRRRDKRKKGAKRHNLRVTWSTDAWSEQPPSEQITSSC